MYRILKVFVLVAVVLSSTLMPTHAKVRSIPLVVFVLDDQIETSSPLYTGGNGLSELDRIFQNLGAQTISIRLSDPLPEDAQVVVVVRPLRTLPVTYLARLWAHIASGNNLLLAIDPMGHNGAYAESANSGLSQLLALDYGIAPLDQFVVDPWFTSDTIRNPITTEARVFADSATLHPVVQALSVYGLPVHTWGMRALDVERLSVTGAAVPLLQSRSGWGKLAPQVFDGQGEETSLAFNAATDPVSPLVVGALAEDRSTGSRVAVLGDSEIVQNGFGLAWSRYTSGAIPAADAYPLHPGNRILAQRIAAWLLELPTDRWPALPPGFTWIAMDGLRNDWAEIAPLARDVVDTTTPAPVDLVKLKAFCDDAYLYALIETAAPPAPDMQIALTLAAPVSGSGTVTLLASASGVALLGEGGTSTAIPDASARWGEAVEIQVPLRVSGTEPVLDEICLCVDCADATAEPYDCITAQSKAVPTVETRSPVPIRLADGPLVTIASSGEVNLRSLPSAAEPRVASLPGGYVFEATGQDRTGEWIQVRDARYGGWIARYLLMSNGDLGSLPVVPAR